MNPNLLEDRLIQFSADIILYSKFNDNSFASIHLSNQIIRSATSSALNYGEARSAESAKDFLHKMKICLKELRESMVNLKIQDKVNTSTNKQMLSKLISENNELISIFVSSIKTSVSKQDKLNK